MSSSTPEQTPLLSGQENGGMATTHANLAKRNLLGGVHTWTAQIGIVVALVVTLRIVALHPAGLFSYHPALQIFSVLFFAEGILLLQPVGNSKKEKSVGLNLHQALQIIGLSAAIAGVSVIWYNKKLHGAAHFTSWHGKLGLVTISLAIIQALVGVVVGRKPGQRLLGESRAKSLWKWHRASGYVNITLLFVTPALALEYADWVKMNSGRGERTLAGLGLFIGWAALITRLNSGKMQFLNNKQSRTN